MSKRMPGQCRERYVSYFLGRNCSSDDQPLYTLVPHKAIETEESKNEANKSIPYSVIPR